MHILQMIMKKTKTTKLYGISVQVWYIFYFLQSYKEKDAGKVVVYTTTMGIVRQTYTDCMKVKQILRTLLVKFEERDVFMSTEYQAEIRDRMRCDQILVPQVFVDGQHIGVSCSIVLESSEENFPFAFSFVRLRPSLNFSLCSTSK